MFKKEPKWLKRFESNHPFLNLYLWTGVFNKNSLGGENKNSLIISEGARGKMTHYRLSRENDELKNLWQKKYLNIPLMHKNIRRIKDAIRRMDSLIMRVNELDRKEIIDFSNTKLLNFYDKYVKFFGEIFACYAMSQPEVSEAAEEKIKDLIKKKISDENRVLDYFVKLSTSPNVSFLTIEEKEWLNILLNCLRNKIPITVYNLALLRLLKNHSRRFGWISTQESLPPLDVNYYLKLLKEQINQLNISRVQERISKIKNAPKLIKRERSGALKILKDKKVANTTAIMAEMSYLRISLRLMWTKAAYFIAPIFEEIGKRICLTEIETKFLTPEEVKDYLVKKISLDKKILKNRMTKYVSWLKNGKLNIYYGNKADKIIKQELKDQPEISKITELRGISASPGIARGLVKVIYSHQDSQIQEVKKMKKGQILVAGSTKPQLIEACRKAAAIITDEGGMLSHAAIVSRELNIPCIVGTKDGTKILKDGDLVEVDANKGVVRILEK